MPSSTKRAPLTLLVMFQAAISAASLVVEIVAGRMLAPYVGMSLYTWTSVIAVVLAGFSAGHWWGGRIAERPTGSALTLTGWLLLAAAVTTGGAVVILRMIAGPIMGATDDYLWTITFLTFGVFFLPSLFAGVPAPVLAQTAVIDANGRSGRALGAMFAAGALGAIGGTLLAGFVFIPWLGTAMTLAIVTVTYLAAATALFAMAGYRGKFLLPLAVAGLALGLGAFSATRLSPCTHESQYYCIRVIDVSSDPADPVRRMVLNHLSHGTSTRDLPRVMFTEFTAMLDAIARGRMGDRQFSAFFIGGGTYSVPRAWADRKTGPITVAELDPQVTQVAIRDFWLDPSGIEILHEDARRALLLRPWAKYDVIIGDAFGDIAVPDHLITREFFELIRTRLNEGGVYLMNVIDFPEGLDALAAIYETLKTVFPSVEIWTKESLPEPGQQRVFVLVAGSQPTGFASVVAPVPEPTRFAAFADIFYNQVLKQRRGLILTDDHAPIDRLLAQGM
jgi:spermidine synthase